MSTAILTSFRHLPDRPGEGQATIPIKFQRPTRYIRFARYSAVYGSVVLAILRLFGIALPETPFPTGFTSPRKTDSRRFPVLRFRNTRPLSSRSITCLFRGDRNLANAQRIQRTLESAIGQFQSGDLDGAAELCSGLLKKQPKNHYALHILGAVRLKQNDPATALKLLKSAAKRDPRNAEVLANLGAAYRMSGNPTGAIDALKKAVALAPRNASAQINLGNAAIDANDRETAVDAYRQVVALVPDHLDARKALARLYHDRNQTGEALSEFRIICDRDRNDPDPFNRMGVLLAESGNHAEAIEKLRIARALAPGDCDIRVNLANVLALNFDIDDATELYREALSEEPASPDVLCNLGNALSRGGKREEAANSYRSAIATHPDHADAHASLANNQLADGNFADGWQHYLYRPSARALSGDLYRAPLPENLSGSRIGVMADQGLGDQVFFARFFPGLRQRGATIAYRPEARLTGMLDRTDIADEIVPESSNLGADFIVSAGDLPFLVGNSQTETPPPIRYRLYRNVCPNCRKFFRASVRRP
ncbi:MAG: tetratricopeptide repeat protein, partial [Alphaproteobacteria bacterium]